MPEPNYFDSFNRTRKGELQNTYYNPFDVKHRKRTSKIQLMVLEKTFETNIKPDANLRKALGEQLGMTPRAVQVWFQNRRAKIKKLNSNKNKQMNETVKKDEMEKFVQNNMLRKEDVFSEDKKIFEKDLLFTPITPREYTATLKPLPPQSPLLQRSYYKFNDGYSTHNNFRMPNVESLDTSWMECNEQYHNDDLNCDNSHYEEQ